MLPPKLNPENEPVVFATRGFDESSSTKPNHILHGTMARLRVVESEFLSRECGWVGGKFIR